MTQRYRRVLVKFEAGVVPRPGSIDLATALHSAGVGPIAAILARYPGVLLQRTFGGPAATAIQTLVARAQRLDPSYHPPDFGEHVDVLIPPGTSPQTVADDIAGLARVDYVYVASELSLPAVTTTDDPLYVDQHHLDPAPRGVNAAYAWKFAGGDGDGVAFIDIEKGWALGHQDLAIHSPRILFNAPNDPAFADHGNSVLGLVCSGDNTVDGLGVAPRPASVRLVSPDVFIESPKGGGWLAKLDEVLPMAGAALNPGDVLLIELQLVSIPMFGTGAPWDDMPVEAEPNVRLVLRLLTAAGVVIIEAAGNGSHDLTPYRDASGNSIFDRAAANFPTVDSGAILVAAGTSACSRSHSDTTNRGPRIDCHGWGDSLTTLTALGTRTDFGGTSGAAAMIAGVAVVVQALAKTHLGSPYLPVELRAILRDPALGTEPSPGNVPWIGYMPDLKRIVQKRLWIAPDVYVRDFVGDTGDSQSSASWASPDILLRRALEPQPQVVWGEGSGMEDNLNLSQSAIKGQDHFVYVRVRNRGALNAVNVTARVYWSPPATLPTPSLWTQIGETVLPLVPTGNSLTVSQPIVWPDAALPASGHYCFIAVLDTEYDPAPPSDCLADWDGLMHWRRHENNVCGRNFNVVEPLIPDATSFWQFHLQFLTPGALGLDRPMRLDFVARLPAGSKVAVEGNAKKFEALRVSLLGFEGAAPSLTARRELRAAGGQTFFHGVIPADAHLEWTLRIELPSDSSERAFDVAVRQFEDRSEIGRITWRLLTPVTRRTDHDHS